MSADSKEPFTEYQFDLEPIRGFPELRWTGKRTLTSTQFFPAQLKESYGDAVSGWSNKVYWGDNLQVMSHLLKEHRGTVSLAYIDPPFDSKADYKKPVKLKNGQAKGDHSAFEEKQYGDIWNNDNYLQFIYERAVLLKELLKDGGYLFVHLDQRKIHHVRCLLEEVFSPENFKNEIIFKRRHGHGDAKTIGTVHDTILVFCKGSGGIWNPTYEPYSEEYIKTYYRYKDEDGRKWLSRSTTAPGGRGPVYEWHGHTRAWRYTEANMQNLHDKGRLYYTENGMPRYKQYLDEMPGLPISSLWDNIQFVDSWSGENTAYPTQKPEGLLERIIRSTTNPGDLVFDCFMGSGTTQATAMKLGRKFIGADINLGAIETTVKRLNGIRENLAEATAELFEDEDIPNEFFTGFEVYNVNNYDIFRNPVEAKELIKEAMELQPLPTNSVFDGQRDQHLVKIMPVNRIATRADLNEVINGMDFKAYERRQAEAPSKIVDRIMLVCMGHEPDIGPELVKAAKPFNIEVEVVDLIRDKANLHFKRQSDAKLVIKDGHLEIAGFYPLNLLQKLSMDTDAVEDWRQLVETIKVDWNYDGAVLSPELIDAPDKNELVNGRYPIPDDASTIRVKITDLLSESWEGEIEHG